MLINKESIFNTIPINVNQRQVFLIEGIRFCVNSISLSFEKLFSEIEFISSNGIREESSVIIFKEAWNQIDTTYRLTNFIKAISTTWDESKIKPGGNFEYLMKTKPFRNSFQHIDERIDEYLLTLNAPIWGNISWLKMINQDSVQAFVISAGHPRNDFNNKLQNPLGLEFKSHIDHISIEAVQKNKDEPISNINLSELYRRTEIIVQKMNKDLEQQLSSQLINVILLQDFLITADMALEDEKK